MAYKPSSKLIESLLPQEQGGYKPSSSLIDNLINETESSDSEKRKQMFMGVTKHADPLGIVTSMLQGVVNSGVGLGRTAESLMGVSPENQTQAPNIRMGSPSGFAEGVGRYLPYALSGGTSFLGSTGAAGAFGATQHEPGQRGIIDRVLNLPPGGRGRNAIEDALINAATHGLGGGYSKIFGGKPPSPEINFKSTHEFSPGESEFTNIPFKPPSFLTEQPKTPLSENIAKELHSNIIGDRSLEESGREAAKHIREAYSNQYGSHKNRYENMFERPTQHESIFTGEPFKVKEIRLDNSGYLKKFRDIDFTDKGLKSLHEGYIENPTIENGHWLQSEIGGEIGYLQKQENKGILDGAGRNKLKEYKKARDLLKTDIRDELHNINPELQKEYDQVTESWKRNVEPYHSHKKLKNIAQGKTKNPTAAELNTIFKNPEEGISTVASHLPQEAKDRLIHIASGKVDGQNTAKDMMGAMTAIERKGMSSYVNPHYEQAFRNIKNNVQMEKEAVNKSEMNQKMVESLKREHERAEQARISAAKTRERLRNEENKESTKSIEKNKKSLQSQYDAQIKQQKEASIKRSNIIRSIIGAVGGGALVHGFGLHPEDILGGYIGKLITKKH